MLKLTYIWHSCFVAETPQWAAVFDFWKDPLAEEGEIPLFLREIPEEKPLYVIVSHHHKDHFTRAVFDWQKVHPRTRYVISHDVERSVRHFLRPDSMYRGFRPDPESVTVVRPGESWKDSLIEIRAFGSTDIGNSYLLTTSGKNIFHAGDLNAWVWKDESTEAEIAAAQRDFEAKIAPLASLGVELDIAMFPVDSRIGRDYWEGAALFVRHLVVKRFFPMHFSLGADEEEQKRFALDACRFEDYANPDRGEYIALQRPYSAFACC